MDRLATAQFTDVIMHIDDKEHEHEDDVCAG